MPQHVEHHRLHGVVVDTEDEIAEHAPDPDLLLGEHRLCLVCVGGLGGDAHLDALYAARLERECRIARPVQLHDALAEHLGEPRLRLTPGTQHPALDDGGDTGAPLQIR